MAKSKYESHVQPKLLLIEGWARNGLIDKEIAERLGISVDSFYEYKKRYADFSDSLKRGKEVIDTEVENALIKRALGYRYQEVVQEVDESGTVKTSKIVTKEVVPDTTAQIFWLKNRRPDVWRDKQDIEHSGGVGLKGLSISFVDKSHGDGESVADPKIVGDYTPPNNTEG